MTFSRLIRISRQRLQSLFRKEQLDDQLDQELLFHLEQLEKENIERGMSPSEARRAARRALGNMTVLKEECRDQRRVSWYYDFCQDARYSVRMMRNHPILTAIAVIALALGIGANTAILNVGGAVLLGDLPLPDSGRLVLVRTVPPENPSQSNHATVPDYVVWREGNRTFEAMGVSIASQQDFGGEGTGFAPERLVGQAVTPSLLATLNVQPQLGRLFNDDEAQAGRPASVVILSERLWQRRFAGDPEIIGKQIRLNGRSVKVIGVMPRGFWYPIEKSEFWVPLAFTRYQLEGSARLFAVTGRLKSGVTLEQAQADVDRIAALREREFPDRQKGWKARVVPLREYWFGWVRQPLLTLEAAVILVLLIVCANVSTLLLARVPAWQPEISLRLRMGMGRGRIVRQLLTESLLLSLIGGAFGVLIARFGVRSLEGLQPPPGSIAISGMAQEGGVFGLAVLISVVSSLLFGFLPALVASSSGNDPRQVTVQQRKGGFSGILVSAQIGLALILLVSSGLFLNSFVRLVLDDRGFNPKGILTFQYRIPVEDYLDRLGSYRGMPAMEVTPPTLSMQSVYEKLKGLPGASSVSATSAPPVNGLVLPTATLQIEGKPVPTSLSARAAATVVYFLVTENFFETMNTQMVRGRDFDSRDSRSTPWVAVINETMANRFWPGEDPIGKHFTVDAASGERPREVIGVVRDVALRYVRTGPPQAVAYTSYLQQPERYEGFNAGMFGQMTFIVRSEQDPAILAAAARRMVAQVDPNRPLTNIQTMTEVVSGNIMSTRRYYVVALTAFAFLAMVLAAVGVYGVMSSSVSQRARELRIRIAMGGRVRDIVGLVGVRAFWPVAAGLLFGFLGSLALTRWLDGQLWGVTSTDPATFAAVTALLIGVSLAACLIPARRAIRVAPARALRAE
jgi:putative ABC transport system permease protein